MATKEEIEQLIPKIIPGCTFEWNYADTHLIGTFISSDYVKFNNKGHSQNWDFTSGRKYHPDKMSCFKYPDGSSMDGPPLTKQERVNLRCKRLWNNSKYVKTFPQHAY